MTVTDEHTVILDDLDFQPPCDITDLNDPHLTPQKCEHPAVWVGVMKMHCNDATLQLLICDTHHKRLKKGSTFRCPSCGEVVAARTLLLRTERLKP